MLRKVPKQQVCFCQFEPRQQFFRPTGPLKPSGATRSSPQHRLKKVLALSENYSIFFLFSTVHRAHGQTGEYVGPSPETELVYEASDALGTLVCTSRLHSDADSDARRETRRYRNMQLVPPGRAPGVTFHHVRCLSAANYASSTFVTSRSTHQIRPTLPLWPACATHLQW